MTNIFKRIYNTVTSSKSYNSLSKSQKKAFKSGISNIKNQARYKLVSGFDVAQRERAAIETRNEDGILNQFDRGRMLNLARNAVRNSPTYNAILKQLDVNVIGTDGGKAILDFQNSDPIKKAFKKWTREVDFYDGLNLNTILKIMLKTYLIGGDMVLLFDDGIVSDSGKLLIFEPDEICSTTDAAIKTRYGQNANQSQGRVYDCNGRFIGVVVSRSQRGQSDVDPSKCYMLKQNPDSQKFDNAWLMPRNVFRISQGRGISPSSAVLGTVIDCEDLNGYELAAAKYNAQNVAVVNKLQTNNEDAYVVPSSIADGQYDSATDAEVNQAIEEEAQANETEQVSVQEMRSIGTVVQAMPEGYDMKLLDTKHPNPNMPHFIEWQAGRCSAAFGMSKQFATLDANGSDFKAQQIMTKAVFEECQKFLEQILDWVIYRWSIWASKKGIISTDPEDWIDDVAWSWPCIEELDENSHQDAIAKGLSNNTMTYKDIYGADWKEKLLQVKAEAEFFKANGLIHPAYKLLSGGESKMLDVDSEKEHSDKAEQTEQPEDTADTADAEV